MNYKNTEFSQFNYLLVAGQVLLYLMNTNQNDELWDNKLKIGNR